MSDEKLKEIIARADDEYDWLKDTVFHQSEEIRELKTTIKKFKEYINNTENWYVNLDDRLMEKPYILVEDLRKQIEED